MVYTEFTEKPEICKFTFLPNGQIKIDMREDITEHIVDDNINIGVDTIWSAMEYSLIYPYRPNLEKDVMDNFDSYLLKAKSNTEISILTEECKTYEQELTKNLAASLLEIDFRLMMLEEIGGTV